MFNIGQAVTQEGFLNRYVVEVTGKYVSAPGEAIVIMGGFVPGEDDVYVSDLVETCKRLINAYKDGRDETDEYYHIEGYETWFAPSALTDAERASLPATIREHAKEWLADPTGAPGSRATFASVQLYYYDGEGTKYSVEYTPEEMRKVSSSMINSIGYESKTQKLRIEFSKGQEYVYFDVPSHVYRDLMSASSVGRHFIANVRDYYQYERVS